MFKRNCTVYTCDGEIYSGVWDSARFWMYNNYVGSYSHYVGLMQYQIHFPDCCSYIIGVWGNCSPHCHYCHECSSLIHCSSQYRPLAPHRCSFFDAYSLFWLPFVRVQLNWANVPLQTTSIHCLTVSFLLTQPHLGPRLKQVLSLLPLRLWCMLLPCPAQKNTCSPQVHACSFLSSHSSSHHCV